MERLLNLAYLVAIGLAAARRAYPNHRVIFFPLDLSHHGHRGALIIVPRYPRDAGRVTQAVQTRGQLAVAAESKTVTMISLVGSRQRRREGLWRGAWRAGDRCGAL